MWLCECSKPLSVHYKWEGVPRGLQIEPEEERLKWTTEESRMSSIYSIFEDKKFKSVKIFGKHDIWPAFQELLGKKSIVMGGS